MACLNENAALQSAGEEVLEKNINKTSRKRSYRKVAGEWPDEKIFTLISIVEQRPTLWNIALPDHKLPKDLVWQEVAAELGEYDWTSCRNKWQSLRVAFKTNDANLKKTKSGQGTSERTKMHWRFFNCMRFIATFDEVNSTESTSNLVFRDDSISSSTSAEMPFTSTPSKKQRSVLIDTPSAGGSQSTRQIAERALSLISPSDEHTAFGEHIAAELRRVPSKDSIKLKRRITRVLLDFWDEQEAQQQEINGMVEYEIIL